MDFSEELYLVFLDIDGVINPHFPENVPTEADVAGFSQVAITNLMYLIEEIQYQTKTPVGIIISSSWKETGDLEHLRKMFRSTPFAIHIIGKTPSLQPMYRPAEILTWLHRNINRYRIRNFVIFDDYPVGLNLFGQHYIQVFEKKLLTSENIQSAISILLSSQGILTSQALQAYQLDLSQYSDYQSESCSLQ